jgi:hypothetical protein
MYLADEHAKLREFFGNVRWVYDYLQEKDLGVYLRWGVQQQADQYLLVMECHTMEDKFFNKVIIPAVKEKLPHSKCYDRSDTQLSGACGVCVPISTYSWKRIQDHCTMKDLEILGSAIQHKFIDKYFDEQEMCDS